MSAPVTAIGPNWRVARVLNSSVMHCCRSWRIQSLHSTMNLEVYPVKGFIGELGGNPAAAMVFKAEPEAGKLATAIVSSVYQTLKWFVG